MAVPPKAAAVSLASTMSTATAKAPSASAVNLSRPTAPAGSVSKSGLPKNKAPNVAATVAVGSAAISTVPAPSIHGTPLGKNTPLSPVVVNPTPAPTAQPSPAVKPSTATAVPPPAMVATHSNMNTLALPVPKHAETTPSTDSVLKIDSSAAPTQTGTFAQQRRRSSSAPQAASKTIETLDDEEYELLLGDDTVQINDEDVCFCFDQQNVENRHN